jgi:hypothetical protein
MAINRATRRRGEVIRERRDVHQLEDPWRARGRRFFGERRVAEVNWENLAGAAIEGGAARPVSFHHEKREFVVPILVPCEVIAALPAGEVGAVRFEVAGIAELDVSCCREKNLPFEHAGRVERAALASCGL